MNQVIISLGTQHSADCAKYERALKKAFNLILSGTTDPEVLIKLIQSLQVTDSEKCPNSKCYRSSVSDWSLVVVSGATKNFLLNTVSKLMAESISICYFVHVGMTSYEDGQLLLWLKDTQLTKEVFYDALNVPSPLKANNFIEENVKDTDPNLKSLNILLPGSERKLKGWSSAGSLISHIDVRVFSITGGDGDDSEINDLMEAWTAANTFQPYPDINQRLPLLPLRGAMKYEKPVLYIFPEDDGASALMGVAGFSVLLDCGFSYTPNFWNLLRHSYGLDGVLLTNWSSCNLLGFLGFLDRITQCTLSGEDNNTVNFSQCGLLHPVSPFGGSSSNVAIPYPQRSNGITEHSDYLLSCYTDENLELQKALLIDRLLRDSRQVLSRTMEMPISSASTKSKGKSGDTTNIPAPIVLFSHWVEGTLQFVMLTPSIESTLSPDWKKRLLETEDSASGHGWNNYLVNDNTSIAGLLIWKPNVCGINIKRILVTGCTPQTKILNGLLKYSSVSTCLSNPEGSNRPTSIRTSPTASTVGHSSKSTLVCTTPTSTKGRGPGDSTMSSQSSNVKVVTNTATVPRKTPTPRPGTASSTSSRSSTTGARKSAVTVTTHGTAATSGVKKLTPKTIDARTKKTTTESAKKPHKVTVVSKISSNGVSKSADTITPIASDSVTQVDSDIESNEGDRTNAVKVSSETPENRTKALGVATSSVGKRANANKMSDGGTASLPKSSGSSSAPSSARQPVASGLQTRSSLGMPAAPRSAVGDKTKKTVVREPGLTKASLVDGQTNKPPYDKLSLFYVDVAFIPNAGSSDYVDIEFFKRIRARYYVLSCLDPAEHVLDALLLAKESWEAKDRELPVSLVPTYNSDVLLLWMRKNDSRMRECNLQVEPSAERCVIQFTEAPPSDSNCHEDDRPGSEMRERILTNAFRISL